MKNLLPILVFSLFAHGVNAAPKYGNLKEFKKHLRQLVKEEQRSQLKTTATYWKLSSSSAYRDMGSGMQISDSAIYKYSNARSSHFDYEYLEYYDEGLDQEDNNVSADTCLKFSDNGSGFELNERLVSTYDAANRRTSISYEDGVSPVFTYDQREVGAYDGNGNLTTHTFQYWNTATNSWVDAFSYFYSYDGQNKLLVDSGYNHFSSKIEYKANYTYDGNGNMTGGTYYSWNGSGWDSSYRGTMVYDANNREIKSLYEEYSGGMWINRYQDTTTYHGTTDIYNYTMGQEWDSAGGVWLNDYQEVRTFNSIDKPATALYRSWDTAQKQWESDAEYEYVYNNNGDPITETGYDFVNGTKQTNPSHIGHFYYEHYFNVGADDVASNETLSIYPNPANNYLHIVNDNIINEVRLINLQGQVAKSVNGNNVNNLVLQVSDLPKGHYVLQINTSGKLINRTVLIK